MDRILTAAGEHGALGCAGVQRAGFQVHQRFRLGAVDRASRDSQAWCRSVRGIAGAPAPGATAEVRNGGLMNANGEVGNGRPPFIGND